jgi:hypothetical protein
MSCSLGATGLFFDTVLLAALRWRVYGLMAGGRSAIRADPSLTTMFHPPLAWLRDMSQREGEYPLCLSDPRSTSLL